MEAAAEDLAADFQVRDLDEPWRIASRERSSTTREYIGVVVDVEDLRTGRGTFADEEEFYRYWGAFPFRGAESVEKQLQKALTGLGAPATGRAQVRPSS